MGPGVGRRSGKAVVGWWARVGVWAGRIALLASLAVLLLVWPLACTTTIHPPAMVRDPARVFLLDHGRTPSLVLPGNGGLVRYVYGDWEYYALRRTGLGSGAAAVLWPTRGALGRQEIDSAPEAEALLRELSVSVEAVYVLEVERERAAALRERLEAIFAENRASMVHTPSLRLHFVHHPERYTYFHNSNHVLAGWLRELGCEVRGPAFRSSWRVGP